MQLGRIQHNEIVLIGFTMIADDFQTLQGFTFCRVPGSDPKEEVRGEIIFWLTAELDFTADNPYAEAIESLVRTAQQKLTRLNIKIPSLDRSLNQLCRDQPATSQ